jgi:cytochrome b subunit of formate dehydrogenase/nitrate/TMAO reductase-like tetraheme cytochrome c subunit
MTVMSSHSDLSAALHGLLLVAALSLAATAVDAQEREINCMGCHDDVHVDSTAHADVACKDCHTNVTRPRHKAEDLADLTGDAICAQCHTVAQRVVGRSVHGDKVTCVDCHGDAHTMLKNNDLLSPMSPVGQVQTCGDCHAQLPGQEQMIDSFVHSVHGRGLLRSGLIGSPTCSTCHGGHRVFEVENERSPTSFKNSPQLCGDCHAYILDEWLNQSAHGAAWKEGNAETATCIDCHASHEIRDPVVDPLGRLGIIDQCGDCHGKYYELYRGDFHGKATNLGLVVSATCADCHHPHATLGNEDPRSTIHPDNLQQTCGDCHGPVTMRFASYNPHIDASDPGDNFYVYLIAMAMHALIIGVFGFFGIHAILWLQRGIVGMKRGEYLGHHSPSGQYVRRFKKRDITMHVVIIVTFLLLAATGLPLKFSYAPWAQTLVDLFGGVENTMLLHRLAAIGTFGYFVSHLGILAYRFFVKREKGLFWGPNSMTPQLKDGQDIAAMFKYFLYKGPRPAFDRWSYWEKFDYLAVFWGMMIIGGSGLMLWFPTFFTSVLPLPGWALNAAYVVHSEEALLATGFIFLFHFFHTHLRLESFPLDPVIFTGSQPLERFKEDRPLEYQRMVEEGTLEQHLVPPPTKEQERKLHFWGFLAVAIGLALAVGIFVALIVH